MPTYEYACKDCGHQFDIFQSFDEDSLTVCPQCKGHLRKKFNSVGVVFKGSGFYRNDSRSSSTGSDAPAASGSHSGSSDSGSSAASSDSAAGSSSSASSSNTSPSASSGSSASQSKAASN